MAFSGQSIKPTDLKHKIMDLLLNNEQSKKEYTEGDLIPKNTSVIVRLVPSTSVPDQTVPRTSSSAAGCSNTSLLPGEKTDAPSASVAELLKLLKITNLAEADMTEEEKIKAMMVQSSYYYNPIHYCSVSLQLEEPLPPNDICFHCGKTGNHIRKCPTIGDKGSQPTQQIRKSAGIPLSFLKEVDDPSMKGVMVTNTKRTREEVKMAEEAYATRKKEKHPFLPQDSSSTLLEEKEAVPDHLLCLICKDLMTDAAIIPCCGTSYCDDCIRTSLLESDKHQCPTCNQTEVSPDSLCANTFLRQAVNSLTNGTSCTAQAPDDPVVKESEVLPPATSHTLLPNPIITKGDNAAVMQCSRFPLYRGQDGGKRSTYCSRSRSHSPIYRGQDGGKRSTYCSRSRSHSPVYRGQDGGKRSTYCSRSRSHSPVYRGQDGGKRSTYCSRSRSPLYRGQDGGKGAHIAPAPSLPYIEDRMEERAAHTVLLPLRSPHYSSSRCRTSTTQEHNVQGTKNLQTKL